MGGDLTPTTLLAAYRHGAFPWFDSDAAPILWWSPDPRTVLFPADLHISRSLGKALRRGGYEFHLDRAFSEVMAACAAPRDGLESWITPLMREAYARLHRMGYAHSAELWRDGRLVGGLYGVAIDQVFFGESMFYREQDASKLAFALLVARLRDWGYAFIDCQMHTKHLERFGAREIPRHDFADLLAHWTPRGRRGLWRTGQPGAEPV